MKTINGNKFAAIDYLRVIACLFVLFTHVFYRYNEKAFSPLQIEGILIYNCLFLARSAVPIFVLISGYTMLEKEYSWQQIFKKVLRMIFMLVFFALLTSLHDWLIGKTDSFSVGTLLIKLWNGSFHGFYWYIYMYIGLLLALPFLQKLVKVMKKEDFIIYFIISLSVSSIFPIVEYYIPSLKLSADINLSFFNLWIGIMLLGHYLKHYPISLNLKTVALFLILFLVAFGILTSLTIVEYQRETNYLFLDNATSFPVILIAVLIFTIFVNCNIKSNPIIESISSYTLSIYMLNEILLFYGNFLLALIQNVFPWLVTLIIISVFLFALGLLLIFPLKKIKYLKNII